MIHYTGYRHDDLMPLVRDLNTTISAPPHKHLNTIRTKYSHRSVNTLPDTLTGVDTLLNALNVNAP